MRGKDEPSASQQNTHRTSPKKAEQPTYLILIDNPTLPLLVVLLEAITFLGDLIDGQVLESGILGELFAVYGLTDAGGAGDDHIRGGAHAL